MTELKRTGECFTLTTKKMLDSVPCSGFMLVHGMPMGQGGEAAKVGRYPHAWIEWRGMCWEPNHDRWFPKDLFYQAGEIEYTERYTRELTKAAVVEHETYGPWSDTLLNRDDEIDAMRV